MAKYSSNSDTQQITKHRVEQLRSLLHNLQIYGYIIPSQDEYLCEYVPDCSKRLEYITGFTGSNGLVIITLDNALFSTDGRYLIQSKCQLSANIFQIFDQKDLPGFTWSQFLTSGYIGYDPNLFTKPMLQDFRKLILVPIISNLIDQIWEDRPSKPSSNIFQYSVEYTGQSYHDKIMQCRQFMKQHGGDVMLFTAPDSICWLLNIRATDILCSPLLLCRLLLFHEKILLFLDNKRSIDLPEVTVLHIEQLHQEINSIDGKVLFDINLTPSAIIDLLQNKISQSITDPCKLWKACKNDIEIDNAKLIHIEDAIAVCEFLASLESIFNYSEYDLALMLTQQRKLHSLYFMDSFPTICGFKENSAIIHYQATQKQTKPVTGSGILLIDSGGHYLGGTTDITRTISIGNPTPEHKIRYTQVLKGHIALTNIKFLHQITGANLDILARQFLWQDGLNYPHGTGHGVGNFLNVHEGPQNISIYAQKNTSLQVGMIVSNEPGYYKQGEFGIRIENLMYVKQSLINKNYLEFETLTLVPYAKSLIDWHMLTSLEIEYISLYYQKITQLISSSLSKKAQEWLFAETTIP